MGGSFYTDRTNAFTSSIFRTVPQFTSGLHKRPMRRGGLMTTYIRRMLICKNTHTIHTDRGTDYVEDLLLTVGRTEEVSQNFFSGKNLFNYPSANSTRLRRDSDGFVILICRTFSIFTGPCVPVQETWLSIIGR